MYSDDDFLFALVENRYAHTHISHILSLPVYLFYFFFKIKWWTCRVQPYISSSISNALVKKLFCLYLHKLFASTFKNRTPIIIFIFLPIFSLLFLFHRLKCKKLHHTKSALYSKICIPIHLPCCSLTMWNEIRELAHFR